MSRRLDLDADDLTKQIDEVRLYGVGAFKTKERLAKIPDLVAQIRKEHPKITPRQVPAELRVLFGQVVGRFEGEKRQRAARILFALDNQSSGRGTFSTRLKDAYLAETGEDRAVRTILGTSYIRRPELEARCKEAIRDGAQIVVLAGDAGVGKSTLASHVAHERAGSASRVVEIDVAKEAGLGDLVRVLDAMGTRGIANPIEARLRFRDVLKDRSSVSLAILHGVEDEQTVDDLIPDRAKLTVIITSSNATLGKGRWPTIRVDTMTSNEAVSMVSALLPDLAPDDALRLADVLGGNPLAIEHVCGYLGRPGSVSLESFLGAFEGDPASALHLRGVERSLKVIYELSLEQMSVSTRHLLDIILSAGATAIHLDYIADLWASLADAAPEIAASSGLAEITLDRALSELEDRSLVRTDYIEVGEPPLHITRGSVTSGLAHHGLLVIHSLTQRVLVSLRVDVVVAIREHVLARLDAAPELDGWIMGKTLRLRDLFRVRASVGLLLQVPEDIVAGHPGACALALRCAYQLGQLPSELADLAALAWHRQADILRPENKNPATTPLAAELVQYMRWNPRATYANHTWDAFDQIRHHNSGLWGGAALLMGNEWLPTLANGIQPQSMLNLTTAATNDAHRRLAASDGPVQARFNNVVLGQCYYIRGTVHYDLGDFDTAASSYGAAADSYKAAIHEGFYVREACESFRRWAETALKAGDGELASKRLRQYQGLLEEVGWPGNPDYASMVRFKLTLAHIEISKQLRHARRGVAFEAPAWATESHDQALSLAITGPLESLYPSAKYGAICFQALTDPRAALDGLEELADWFGKGFGLLRCELAALKLRAHLALEGQAQLANNAAIEAQSLADRFQADYLARYWSADALATALALGKLTGQPPDWLADVQARAATELEAIKRLDKLEIAVSASSADFSALRLLAE